VNLRLKVVGGELEHSEVDMTLPATLGRGSEASLRLVHPLVSRLHCELFEREGQVWVRDLRSLNGTFVGSERVGECLLRPGDLLTVGVVTFRASYQLQESPEFGSEERSPASGVPERMEDAGRPVASPKSSPVPKRRVLRHADRGDRIASAGDTEPLPTDLAPPPAIAAPDSPSAPIPPLGVASGTEGETG